MSLHLSRKNFRNRKRDFLQKQEDEKRLQLCHDSRISNLGESVLLAELDPRLCWAGDGARQEAETRKESYICSVAAIHQPTDATVLF